jgi:two-component system cell cycle response regulator DivK
MQFPLIKKHILVLDKGSRVLSAAHELLLYGNYDLHIIYDPNYVQEKAQDLLPDLIILDYLLIDNDCQQIIQDLQEVDSLKNIPVIVVTAYRSKKVVADSYKCDALFVKPLDMNVLATRMEYLMAS